MDADAVVGVGVAQPRGDAGPPVPALRHVTVVAELLRHQLGHHVADGQHVQPSLLRRVGEAVARHRGRDHVEGIARVSAVGRRVRQHGDDLVHLEEGPRPSVGDDQRQWVRSLALLMDEVDLPPVHRGLEVGEAVDQRLLLSPVEVVLPVLDQLLDVVHVGAVLPPDARQFVRPAGTLQPPLQVIQHRIRNFNLERLHRHNLFSYQLIPSP